MRSRRFFSKALAVAPSDWLNVFDVKSKVTGFTTTKIIHFLAALPVIVQHMSFADQIYCLFSPLITPLGRIAD